jgi:uncharacterized protein
MKLNLVEVLRETGNREDVRGELKIDNISYRGEEFRFITSPYFDGYVYNNGQSLTLKGQVSMKLEVNCARCMKSIERDFEFELEETLVREDKNPDPDGDEIVFSGEEIDIADIVIDGFYVNVPGKFLCKEDCKGLCPECGADLNEGECGCDTETIDPRWEALKKIMDSSKDN